MPCFLGVVHSILDYSLGVFVTGAPRKMSAEEKKLLGNEKYKAGSYHEAMSLYSAAIDLSPGQANLYSNRAAAFLMLDRDNEAFADCEKAISLDPNFSKPYVRGARCLSKLKRFSEARELLTRMPSSCHDDARAKEKAENEIIAIIGDGRLDQSETRKSEGNRSFSQGQYQSAISSYADALALLRDEYSEEARSQKAKILCNKAAAHSKLGQHEQAIVDADASLSISPGFVKALLRRAVANMALKRYQEALTDYERLESLGGGSEDVTRGLAEARQALGLPVDPMGGRGGGCCGGRGPCRGGPCGQQAAASSPGTGKLVHVSSDQEFLQYIQGAGSTLVAVDFSATWCGPCRMISPVFEQMASQRQDVIFLKVDIDQMQQLAAQYRVASVPTFLFFKNGQVVDQFSGASADMLRQYVDKHAAS